MSRPPPTRQQGVSRCSGGTCPGQMDSTQSAGREGQFRSFFLSFLDLRGGLSPKAVLGGPFKIGMR